MGSLNHPELALDCRFSPKPFVQGPIARLTDISKICTVSEKILKLDDIVNRLQDEMKKIDAFKRELPLSMVLLNDAIVAAQEELAQCNKLRSETECIPFKILYSGVKDEDRKEVVMNSRDEKNWMSSVQMNADDQNSNSNTADYSSNRLSSNTYSNKKERKGEEINQRVMGDLFESGKSRAFVPFKGCSSFGVMKVREGEMEKLPVSGPGLSLCLPGTKISSEAINSVGSSHSISGPSLATSNLKASFKTGQVQIGRKQRRCWSPELHRQFLNALQHLGGPQVATPKQIREHMQVNGLTNDEVKSHLQKYRLHLRRTATNSTPSQEQFSESFKQSSGHSGSPDGPLHLSRCLEGGETLEDEDDD